MTSTNDKIIRVALRNVLDKDLKEYLSENGQPAEIFEELGVRHGTARIDIAVINGDRKSTRLNSSHIPLSRMPSSA